jgi:hypothetical protein
MLYRQARLSLAAVSWLTLWLAGCGSPMDGSTSAGTSGTGTGSTGTAVGGGSGTGAGGQGGASSSSSSSSSTGGSGGIGGAGHVALCLRSCQTAADCSQDSPTHDTDNYACTDGACEYLGCHSDAECNASMNGTTYTCKTDPALPTPYCAETCRTNTDCGSSSSPVYDADHFACTDGECDYLGCKSDAECTSVGPDYFCATDPMYPVPYCLKHCQTGADCSEGLPALDADNYACTGNSTCQYVGCKTDQECKDSFNDIHYVCK